MHYDVIVVGARVAGASTAMLLARAGLRVLVLDQARFPSDTLSTHQLHVPGVARLARWGLLDRLLASGLPPTRRLRFDNQGIVLDGTFPAVDGVDVMLSPRRTVLDALLVDAARAAGADVREATVVDGVCRDGDRVVGVTARAKGKDESMTESADLVIGADGSHSRIAKLVGATEYRARPPRTVAFYSYWNGLPVTGGEIYALGDRVASAWPTHDGLVITYVAWPGREFDAYRHDPDAAVRATLDTAGTLGQRARAAQRVGPVRGTNALPNVFRQASGPGWALVGDAGLAMDPITGLGMSHALRDAELAAAAIIDGRGPRDAALTRYGRQRDKQTKPIYDFTVGLAGLDPPTPVELRLFRAIAADPQQTRRLFGTINGSLPMRRFFAPPNLVRLVGWRGFAQLARQRPH
ncbi:MAG TPA: NAD(P)/FAD-dependent oxidoreductase [Jatrophihabitantaceae bacterium]|jgi:2-polyprenyl-6-methoxyphenol hydroxylase-like FAD-dependent oxidoreductase